MCDEVQDLPQNIILLLTKITQTNIFFSGDNAQSIYNDVVFNAN